VLITKHFVLLHFPRTGGVFLRRACRAHLPRDWILAEPDTTHAYHAKVPEEFMDLPMITFIRNPWDWYVSFYEFTTQYWAQAGKERVPPSSADSYWGAMFDHGRNDFRQTVAAMCSRPDIDRAWAVGMREWDVDYLTATFTLTTGRLPAGTPADSPVREFFSAQPARVEVGRYESLRDDMLGFLERHDVPAVPEFIDAVRSAPARHQSRRKPYREYYDDELRDLVASKSRPIIDEYGYDF
jgi:hypothetical protein